MLNDPEFLEASLRSVYPHITGATVITRYDRDRWDQPVVPDRTVELLLSREIDPERKVNLIVSNEESEPRQRNRAMAFNHLPRRGRRVVPTFEGPPLLTPPDYFWIIDADEIYDDDNVARLKAYIARHPAQSYLVWADSYFRTWNWRIEEDGWYVAVVRPGFWFGHIRQPYPGPRVRAFEKLAAKRVLPERVAYRFLRSRCVPRDVAVFHHGSYVGGRDRIEQKFATSGHRPDLVDSWMERVWDNWTPDMRDFHPLEPARFPSATFVPTADLPPAIREHRWPAGWIDRDGAQLPIP